LSSKTVLILGRFTEERKIYLEAMATQSRALNLIPIIFDFEKPTERDFTETIRILAGMCFFIIADIRNPKSSPLELQSILPDYEIAFVPIIHEDDQPFSMFHDLNKYHWMLPLVKYSSLENLKKGFKSVIYDRACEKNKELIKRKLQVPELLSFDSIIAKTQ